MSAQREQGSVDVILMNAMKDAPESAKEQIKAKLAELSVLDAMEFPDLKSRLQWLTERMSKVAEETYWYWFWSGLSGEVHAFIEFNGLIGEFVKLCSEAAKQGVDFRSSNRHNEIPLPAEDFHIAYFAEKLDCIIGPTLRSNPAFGKIFREKLGI